ncbi:MAG: DUF4864 domain-containing protein [Chthoniobacterales bacterium]
MTSPVKASLLLFFFSLCGAAFIVTSPERRHPPPPRPGELFNVVNEQLAAFRVADFRDAYRRASSGVQQKFTLPQFEAMVRHTYADMATAQRVEFGLASVEGNTAWVQVFFFAGDGRGRSFIYSLIAEEDGWKIGGVEESTRLQARQRLAGMQI